MFDIFAGLFDFTLFTLKMTPDTKLRSIVVCTLFNTAVRVLVFAGFTYGAIRVVITAVSHGSF